MARRLLECGIHGLQRVSQRAVALDVFCEIPCMAMVAGFTGLKGELLHGHYARQEGGDVTRTVTAKEAAKAHIWPCLIGT